MKIAITGATGFIGTYLVEKFSLDGQVATIPLTRNKKSFFYTDYSVQDLIKWFRDVDAVVHLASKRGGKGVFSEYEQNILLSEKVSQACKESNVKKLIMVSSISVYSNQDNIPWREEQKSEPLNYYGLSKLVSEEVCRLNLKESNTQLIILRLAHVYGPNEKNNYMINLFIRKAFNNDLIHVTNVSENRREFIYVKDVVNAIALVCKKNVKSNNLILNVGSNDILTNQEVAKVISSTFNSKNLKIDKISPKISKEHSYMQHKKIEDLYSYKPEYDMNKAMSEIHAIMRSAGKNVPIFY